MHPFLTICKHVFTELKSFRTTSVTAWRGVASSVMSNTVPAVPGCKPLVPLIGLRKYVGIMLLPNSACGRSDLSSILLGIQIREKLASR